LSGPTRVIACGQALAGDDGVGFAVLARLRERSLPGLELAEAGETAALLTLLATPRPIVLIDAVVARPAGQVVVLTLADLLAGAGPGACSTHGLSVGRAVALARALLPPGEPPVISLVGITIETLRRGREGLSAAVAAAVPRAVEAVLELARGSPGHA
jgi:hydrogenase maturation protease